MGCVRDASGKSADMFVSLEDSVDPDELGLGLWSIGNDRKSSFDLSMGPIDGGLVRIALRKGLPAHRSASENSANEDRFCRGRMGTGSSDGKGSTPAITR